MFISPFHKAYGDQWSNTEMLIFIPCNLSIIFFVVRVSFYWPFTHIARAADSALNRKSKILRIHHFHWIKVGHDRYHSNESLKKTLKSTWKITISTCQAWLSTFYNISCRFFPQFSCEHFRPKRTIKYFNGYYIAKHEKDIFMRSLIKLNQINFSVIKFIFGANAQDSCLFMFIIHIFSLRILKP